MSFIPPPPSDVKQCIIFMKLLEKSTSEDGLAERVERFISVVSPLLDLIIAGPFRNYTLHNPSHSKKLIHLAGQIISQQTMDYLSALELSIIIMSCYLHDLGMCLTSHERNRILSSIEFSEEIRNWPQIWDEIESAREIYQSAPSDEKFLIEARIFQLQESGLTSYLRPRHATREKYSELIIKLKDGSGRSDLFQVRGVSFESELKEICISHNLDAGVLLENIDPYTDRFPRDLPIGGMRLNAQFCAAVLRLADILDFDNERTPSILFESLGITDTDLPDVEVSLREWNKHMAVHTIDLRDQEIVVSADSTHPAIERSIREFCSLIEREIRDTISILRKNPQEVLNYYQIDIPLNVRAQVRSIGYIYKDLSFILDESSISKILMGEGLYTNKAVAIRELIQNSIDACCVRQLIIRDNTYSPAIKVTSIRDDKNRTWLEVEDNGIGMDEYVISNYFFRIGRSYYNTPEFDRIIREFGGKFSPISRFGIGILSVFMIGDILEVTTQNQFSTRGDTLSRTLRVVGRFGLAFVTESPSGRQGTKIKVRLNQKSPELADIFLYLASSYLKKTVRRPAIPITVDLKPLPFILETSSVRSLGLKDNAIEILEKEGIEPIVIDVGRWREKISGYVILFLFITNDGKLIHTPYDRKINTNELRVTSLKNYKGNTITVNGITMSFKRIGSVFGRKDPIITAIDLDIKADEDITYDVSREKLVGSGKQIVVNEIIIATIKGLKELGVYEKLHNTTKEKIEFLASEIRPSWSIKYKPLSDNVVLDTVLEAMPEGKWPIGIHRIIAGRKRIPPTTVYRAISTLIESGRLKKPSDRKSVV